MTCPGKLGRYDHKRCKGSTCILAVDQKVCCQQGKTFQKSIRFPIHVRLLSQRLNLFVVNLSSIYALI